MPLSDEPRISVIVPAYNSGAYITEALQSILRQTLSSMEILVIDDGSTDETADVVRRIGDERVLYHWQPNCGVSEARNRGLKLASGEFISFLDADDRWLPGTLSAQYQLMKAVPDAVCCFGNFTRFLDGTNTRLDDQFVYYPELQTVPKAALNSAIGWVITGDAFPSIVAFGDWPAFPVTIMYRAKSIQHLRFNAALRRCEDADFFLRAILGGTVAFTDRILAEVRRHGDNATSRVDLMPVDKLKALECVQQDPRASEYWRELDHRLLRARFDAGIALAKRGRWAEAGRCWIEAIQTNGPLYRKLTGSIRLSRAYLIGAANRKW